MRTSSLIAGLMITTLPLATLSFSVSTFADVVGLDPTVVSDENTGKAPSAVPSGTSAPPGGYFSQYFSNLANNDCTSSQIVSGFDNNANTYLKPTCTLISSVLAGYFGTLGLSSNAPVVFNANGTATNLDMSSGSLTNTMVTNLFANNNYTTALTTWINNNGGTLNMQSQWKDVTGGIAYTGGNIALGSTNTSAGKMYVAGKTVIGDFVNYLPDAGNPWNYNIQLTGYPTTSIGFYDAEHTSASAIKYTSAGFVIGTDDGGGWGTKSVSMGSNLNVNAIGSFGTLAGGNYTQVLYNPLYGGEVRANSLSNGRLNLNWQAGNGGVHVGNGSSGYGDLYARNLNATNNINASGTINLGSTSNICFGGNCYNETQIVGGSAVDTGSFLHPSMNLTLQNNYIPKMGSAPGDKNGVLHSNIYDDGSNVIIGKLNNTTLTIKGNAGATTLTVNGGVSVTENVTANGFLYSSDRNLKKNITPLEGSLEKVLSLKGYSYNWKSSGRADVGVIAQEVETVYPELVHTDKNGIKSVEYANLIAPLIEAVKSQQKEIEALKAEVANLKK